MLTCRRAGNRAAKEEDEQQLRHADAWRDDKDAG